MYPADAGTVPVVIDALLCLDSDLWLESEFERI